MVQGGKQSQNEAHISQPKLDLILNAKKKKNHQQLRNLIFMFKMFRQESNEN